MSAHEACEVEIDEREWLAEDVDLLCFDRSIHAAEDTEGCAGRVSIRVVGSHHSERRNLVESQVAMRYQRLTPRRNEHSNNALFSAIIGCHRELHTLSKPLVRADYDHAVDVWQWLLRLAPAASLELQTAGLFHDVERLESEPDRRIEQSAPDYLSFKTAHARRGAAIVGRVLAPLAMSAESIARIQGLVSSHEQPRLDAELALLNDADALSFFALNSPGFIRYFDAEHSAKKIAYTLSRMSPSARDWLPTIRLERRVSELLERARRQLA